MALLLVNGDLVTALAVTATVDASVGRVCSAENAVNWVGYLSVSPTLILNFDNVRSGGISEGAVSPIVAKRAEAERRSLLAIASLSGSA